MKVAVLGSKSVDTLEYHLIDSFKFLGHEVYSVDLNDIIPLSFKYNFFAAKFIKSYDEFLFKKIARKILEYNVDLIICTYRFINPICIKLLKENQPHTKIIHINPDAITTFQNQQIFASPYDAYFTKDLFILEFMKNKLDLNTFYLPEAFNPRVHKKPKGDKCEFENAIDIDVITFGTIYPYRAKMATKLIDSGINVQLFGTPDRRFDEPKIKNNFNNEYIVSDRKSELIFGSKIVFNNFHYAEINSANVKFFEVAGIGGFQICDYKPILEDYSIIPVEKFTYNSIGEAVELIKYYIDKPMLRHEISNLQYCHFLNNHTYEHRVNQILNLL